MTEEAQKKRKVCRMPVSAYKVQPFRPHSSSVKNQRFLPASPRGKPWALPRQRKTGLFDTLTAVTNLVTAVLACCVPLVQRSPPLLGKAAERSGVGWGTLPKSQNSHRAPGRYPKKESPVSRHFQISRTADPSRWDRAIWIFPSMPPAYPPRRGGLP